MFDQLVESRPQRERSLAQMIGSIVVHTMIIAVSIQLTRAAATTVAKAAPDLDMALLRAPAPPNHSPAAAAAAAPLTSAPPRLPTVAVPITVPSALPPVNLASGYDPARIGRSNDGPPSAIDGDGSNIGVGSDLVATLTEVDEPVVYLDGPSPAYPAALRQVGIEGWVQLRFIVGTDGLAEPHSVEALKSSNGSFEASAIAAIMHSRFRPARIKGRKVRQLVEQMVRFTLH